MPEVSVIMPAYNCEAFIGESVESILKQSFTDFEFIIIDDASTDKTVEMIRGYNDPRIILLVKPGNTGYTDSLNMAIRLAKGKYIARMDADDIALVNRFEVQYRFLEKNKDTLVVGSHYKIIGTDTTIHLPVTYDEVKITAMMHVPVAHPTAFIRKEVFTKYAFRYDKNFEPAEDYDLWCKVLEKGKIENIDEVLLLYRHHNLQQSKLKHKRIVEVAVGTRSAQLQKLIDFTGRQYDPLFAIDVLTKNIRQVTKPVLKTIRTLLDDLYAGNKKKNIYNQKLFGDYLKEKWSHYIGLYNFMRLSDIPLLFPVKPYTITRVDLKFAMNRLLKISRFKNL